MCQIFSAESFYGHQHQCDGIDGNYVYISVSKYIVGYECPHCHQEFRASDDEVREYLSQLFKELGA